MNGKDKDLNQAQNKPLACVDCQAGLQDYLDGTLEKKLSLRFFLHLRDCESCRAEQEAMQGLFELLDNLPRLEAPADFDEAILASVPYAAYREMEPLRRERVPVYLTEHFLPGFVRSRATRVAGVGMAVAAIGAYFALAGPQWLPAVAGVGVVPELLVRLQGIGRRVVALGRVEG